MLFRSFLLANLTIIGVLFLETPGSLCDAGNLESPEPATPETLFVGAAAMLSSLNCLKVFISSSTFLVTY